MAPNHTWIHRIPEVLERLEASETTEFLRQNVADLFDVRKGSAIAIMRELGGSKRGVQWVIGKRDLLRALNRMLQGKRFAELNQRQARIRQTLDDPALKLKRTAVAQGEPAGQMVSSRLSKLPAGVNLSRESLHIDFQGPEDFLLKFGAVVFALQNDYSTIQGMLKSSDC